MFNVFNGVSAYPLSSIIGNGRLAIASVLQFSTIEVQFVSLLWICLRKDIGTIHVPYVLWSDLWCYTNLISIQFVSLFPACWPHCPLSVGVIPHSPLIVPVHTLSRLHRPQERAHLRGIWANMSTLRANSVNWILAWIPRALPCASLAHPLLCKWLHSARQDQNRFPIAIGDLSHLWFWLCCAN